MAVSIETFYRRKAKVYSVHKIMMVFIKLLVQRNTGCVACHSLTHNHHHHYKLNRNSEKWYDQILEYIYSVHSTQCTYTYTNNYKNTHYTNSYKKQKTNLEANRIFIIIPWYRIEAGIFQYSRKVFFKK